MQLVRTQRGGGARSKAYASYIFRKVFIEFWVQQKGGTLKIAFFIKNILISNNSVFSVTHACVTHKNIMENRNCQSSSVRITFSSISL